jgi:hypothetical protein
MNIERRSINGQASQFKQVSNRFVLMGFVVTMSFLVLFLTYLPATLYGSSGPVASISEKQYDFGEVADESEVVHDFLFKNPGVTLLKISEVKTG